MFSFLVSEALRDLRRAGRVGLSAILLITLSLGALGCFWLVSLNLGRAVTQWRERVRVVAYLEEEPRPPPSRTWSAGCRRSGASSACATSRARRHWPRSSARWGRRPAWWSSSRGTRCPRPSS